MEKFTNIKKIVDRIMDFFCVVLLSVMTILVSYQVITRYFFNKPSAVSEVTAQYLFVWMVMFGTALVFGERGHLEISTLKDKLSPGPLMIVEVLSNLTLIIFSALVCFIGGWNITSLQMNTVDAALGIPMGVIYVSIPLCGIIMCFYAVYNIALAIYGRGKNDTESASDNTAGTM